jgi:hypothetical protein
MLLSSRRKLGTRRCRVGPLGLRLSKPAFSPPAFLVVVQDPYHRSQRAKVFAFHVRTSLWHPQLGLPRCMYYWLTWDRNCSILTCTYHVFDKLKVIIMGNGYGVIGTFLFGPAKYIEREQSCPNVRTSTI